MELVARGRSAVQILAAAHFYTLFQLCCLYGCGGIGRWSAGGSWGQKVAGSEANGRSWVRFWRTGGASVSCYSIIGICMLSGTSVVWVGGGAHIYDTESFSTFIGLSMQCTQGHGAMNYDIIIQPLNKAIKHDPNCHTSVHVDEQKILLADK